MTEASTSVSNRFVCIEFDFATRKKKVQLCSLGDIANLILLICNRQTREIQGSKNIKALSAEFLMKVLSSCNAPKTLNAKDMEALTAHPSEEDLKKRHFFMTCDNEDEASQLIDRHRKRKNVISLPFMFRRSTHESETQGHLESELKSPLFDYPLSLVYGVEDTLPKSIQDILMILFRKGPFTEGIFRKAANEKARKELREELNAGDNVALEKKSVYLLAAVFKDFLRNIPHKLLLSELYDEWMTALEKINPQERTEAMKGVASKLPKPNLHLLKHLLSLLHHISKNSEVNKMDSSNLAICFGPTMLSPNNDKSLPLEIQKELADKVKALVEFLINNCSDIFGEEIYSLFCMNTDNSLDMSETLSPNQHHDSAYDSTDFEGECSSSDLQSKGLSHTSRPSSTELYPKQPLTQIPSALPLTHFKRTVSKLDRRFSEPDLWSSKGSQEGCVRFPKPSKSEENFILQKELGQKCRGLRMRKQTVESHLSGLYRNKKPSNLTIKGNLPSELSSDSLLSTSSSSSLDSASSVSDSSVFTSSPLSSPSIFKNSVLTQPRSFSPKISNGSDRAVPELKKHSMSFSVATCKKMLAKTESCGIGGFQRGSFKKYPRKERPLSCQIVQATHVTVPSPEPPGCQLRSRFMSADEVFRLVDQKKPRSPPSYEEATKHFSAVRLPLHNNLRAPPLRFVKVPQDSKSQCLRLKKEVTNKANEDLFNDRPSLINASQDKTPVVDFVIGIHSRANLPLTPQVYRLRTMSGSYQKNKQEYLTRRSSQITFEHLQCAKESYV
ncbi:T-cell activation Rho GTPase-activating protein isoform X2 [Python bivittatus]|uniref:T-cell activation Rho GTPase-activating protein n=1 Tax=Python bivittatus TaxID=176946 RepID=A0A9F3QSB2_PYTBI|nr:T-cell activation Rho GTPase-activating protein isoform X2 [Python bivittatus]